MEFPKLTFNHDEDSFVESLGFTDHQFDMAKYTIVFEMISVMVLEEELDVEIENTNSKSSILERSLNRFKDQSEHSFLVVLLFDMVYRDTKKQLDFLNKLGEDGKKKDASDIFSVMKIKAGSLEDAMEKLKMVMQSEKMIQLLSFLKDSKCDYNKFIDYTVNEKGRSELLGEEKPTRRKKSKKSLDDIDELIRKAFMNKDEDDDDE